MGANRQFAPSTSQVRWFIKPLWFLACLAPFIWMNLEAFEVIESQLGDDPIQATQQFMGVWAFRLLLLTLAISPAAKLLRQPWLLRLRRMTGLFALFYAGMHLLNYLGADKRFDWPGIFADSIENPFIVFGAIALFVMFLLGLTSTKGWQRRLGSGWHKLHRWIYAIAILVALHFWLQDEESYLEPAVYTVILAALLGYRIAAARRRA